MSYALVIEHAAENDLRALLMSLPSAQYAGALDAVHRELSRLGLRPLPKAGEYLGRPAHEFTFKVEGVSHHWGAAYRVSEDEASLMIIHVYRVPSP